MQLLENEHIRLRMLEPEDLDTLYEWENDTSYWVAGDTVSPYSRYVLKQYLAESHKDIYENKQLRLVIESKTGNKTVGLADLYSFDTHHNKAGVGIMTGKEYQQKGFASRALELLSQYAFRLLHIHQLYVYVETGNEASRRLFTHGGFTPSATLKDWINTPEGYKDVIIYQKFNSAE